MDCKNKEVEFEQYNCDVCNKEVGKVITTKYGNEVLMNYCNNCYKKFKDCFHCAKLLTAKAELFYLAVDTNADPHIYCDECFTRIKKCDNCGYDIIPENWENSENDICECNYD